MLSGGIINPCAWTWRSCCAYHSPVLDDHYIPPLPIIFMHEVPVLYLWIPARVHEQVTWEASGAHDFVGHGVQKRTEGGREPQLFSRQAQQRRTAQTNSVCLRSAALRDEKSKGSYNGGKLLAFRTLRAR